MLILGGAIALGMSSMTLRVIFWIGLGLVAASFSRFGMPALSWAIVALIAVSLFMRGGRQTLLLCRDSHADGAKTALPVGIACAIVGIIIGTMTLTGAANTFGQFVVAVGKESLFLSLLLTMVTCLILGMGIPTIPNYIITSSIAGPALLELGASLLVSHMFVFYFGILADLTPPVALACFAAAPIAIGLWGAAVIGYLIGPMNWPERVLAAATAITLIAALPLTDEIGFMLAALAVAMHWRGRRRRAATTTTSACAWPPWRWP